MTSFKQYKTNDGNKMWMFRTYVGHNILTGKKQYKQKRGFATKREAKAAATKFNFEHQQNGVDIAPEFLTFRDAYTEWDAVYKNTVRESTYNTRQIGMNKHVLPAFGGLRLSAITTRRVQKVVNAWAKTSKASYRWWLVDTKRVFNFAIQQGYITRNPAAYVTIPQTSVQEEPSAPNFWDRAELKQFFSSIDLVKYPKQYTYFRVLAFTGLRRGEAAALTWGDVSSAGLRVNKTVAQGYHGKLIIQAAKTKAGERIVPLDPKTTKALSEWHREQLARGEGNELVFPSINGNILSNGTPATWLKNFTELAKMEHPIRLHGFRHSAASALFAAGLDMKVVQARLGHKDIRTTMNVYAHVSHAQAEQAPAKLVQYLDF
jgi:integrase